MRVCGFLQVLEENFRMRNTIECNDVRRSYVQFFRKTVGEETTRKT
jgi:hypothetical protein